MRGVILFLHSLPFQHGLMSHSSSVFMFTACHQEQCHQEHAPRVQNEGIIRRSPKHCYRVTETHAEDRTRVSSRVRWIAGTNNKELPTNKMGMHHITAPSIKQLASEATVEQATLMQTDVASRSGRQFLWCGRHHQARFFGWKLEMRRRDPFWPQQSTTPDRLGIVF